MTEIKKGKQENLGRHWYAIQTNPGYEKTVLKNLKQRIETLGMEDYIFDVVVPTKKVKKIKRGKEVEVEENIYPGYVLVNMIVNDRSWLVVRNTPRVSGFLGTGVNPVPVSNSEMASILGQITAENTEVKIEDFEVGDLVEIKSGAFAGNKGKIKEINAEKDEITVILDMFGRETEVTLSSKDLLK